MLALLPAILALAPSLAEWLSGPKAAAVTSQAVAVVQAVTGSADPEVISNLPPEKRAELQIRLAEIAAEQRRAELADVANARQQTAAMAQAGSYLAWGAPAVTVVMLGLFAWVVVANVPTELDIRETIKALTVACVSYWIGSSRGSADNRAANERLTTALVDRQAPSSAPIINQPTGTVVTGSTTDELNNASYRAARGG
jgi:hypothetical protein